jgi:hypothetical protein
MAELGYSNYEETMLPIAECSLSDTLMGKDSIRHAVSIYLPWQD